MSMILQIKGASQKSKRMANSLDPDETARYEPSHQDLHCFHRYLAWSAGPKGLKDTVVRNKKKKKKQQKTISLSCPAGH